MKRDFLSSLSRAARWYLPPDEAAEVLEDYQDIVGRERRSEEQLRRDLGDPGAAARQLAQPKAYRRWRTVYVWGLTGAVLNIFLWKVLTSMSIDFNGSWQFPYLIRLVLITVVGILGTAVSLC